MYFNTGLAEIIGVDEAILAENIAWWVKKNQANEKNFHEGKYWTYNSRKAFLELFPFWTESQLKRVLKSLQNKNVIVTGNFSKGNFNRTNYYSISDKYSDFFDGLKTTKRIGANQPNPLDENDQTITDINITDINNYKKNKQKKIFTGSDCFEAFWKSYSSSRKGSKETASKAYQKALDRDTAGNILKGAKSYAESAESRGKYGKGCAAWLNDDRWIIDYPREEKPTDKQTPDDIFSTDKTIEEMKKEDDEWSPF